MGFKKRSVSDARAELIARAVSARGSNSGPLDLDEVLDEPLYDASGAFRVRSRLEAGAQRGADESDDRRFRDPSLVIEAEARGVRDDRRPEAEDGEQEGALFGAYLESLRRSRSED